MVERKDAPRSGPVGSVGVMLSPGWHYDSKRRAFVSPKGGQVSLRGVLPKSVRVTHVDPEAVRAAASGTLSKGSPEHDLARYVQVAPLPADAVGAAVRALEKLPCVTKAAPGPEISAPHRA